LGLSLVSEVTGKSYSFSTTYIARSTQYLLVLDVSKTDFVTFP
jgi:hypothetical protein